jgi:FKBP-type peptidyl-prolyl cis-trans isomerase 2
MKRWIDLSKFVVIAGLVMVPLACAANMESKIRTGSYVMFDYTLTADGQTMVSSARPETMKLVVGQGSFPPDFEDQLIGLSVGSKKVISLSPNEAFGPIREDRIMRVPKETLPSNVTEGMRLGATGADGGQVSMRVVKILDDTVVLDQNHPLAGRTLVYEVSIRQIN